jgi:hypothetical protein
MNFSADSAEKIVFNTNLVRRVLNAHKPFLDKKHLEDFRRHLEEK